MSAALGPAFDGRCHALLFCALGHRIAPNAANPAAECKKLRSHSSGCHGVTPCDKPARAKALVFVAAPHGRSFVGFVGTPPPLLLFHLSNQIP